MRLKSTNVYPPGGFLYVQPETGFRPMKMASFSTVVAEIMAHRKANGLPRQSREEVESDIHEYNSKRLGLDPQWVVTDKKKVSAFSKASPSPDHLRSLVRHAGEKLKSLGVGAKIMADWLGDGMLPVSSKLTQSRADVCTGRISGTPCRFNQKGSRLTESVASAIKDQMQQRHQATAAPEGEGNLFECQICFCDLKLKVHVPMETIIDRTPKAMIQKFQEQAPAVCWMKTENKNPA